MKQQRKFTVIRLTPDSSWGKETMKFKVDKKDHRLNKEKFRCSGELCKDKDKGERNIVHKGEECPKCYNEEFKKLRYSPSEETPHFDAQFLTRLDLV
jgi:hypothetical protein